LASLALFWLNIGLLAWSAGGSAAAWVGAATLAPVWDYGLEVRHDNILLFGLLAIWLLRRGGASSWFAVGVIAAALQLAVFKSFVYWAPLSAWFLWKKGSRSVAAWGAGFLLALIAARAAYGGLWGAYIADFADYFSYSNRTERFLPLESLARLVWQTPLLLVLLASAFREAYRKKSLPPEGTLCLGALLLLFVNPTPYPYNLLHFVPFAFLFAFRHGSALLGRPRVRALAWTAVIFGHLAPFAAATARHALRTNERQELLMATAESLARPGEPVYDAIGMIPSRPAAGFHWYSQSLVARKFVDGTWPSVRETLARNPPPVVIASYRTDWLSAEDREFLRARWLPLADDFWVREDRLYGSGARLPPGDRRTLFVNWY
jgi:hypothetical protein